MYYTAKCGCLYDIDLYVPYGCCCGDCYHYDSVDIENVEVESRCAEHGGTTLPTGVTVSP